MRVHIALAIMVISATLISQSAWTQEAMSMGDAAKLFGDASAKRVATASCPSVDLRNAPGATPVRNQADEDWCFASVSADLLSYYVGKPVSYLDLGIKYVHQYIKGDTDLGSTDIRDNPKQIRYGAVQNGNAYSMLEMAISNGVCPENDFSQKSRDIENAYTAFASHWNGVDNNTYQGWSGEDPKLAALSGESWAPPFLIKALTDIENIKYGFDRKSKTFQNQFQPSCGDLQKVDQIFSNIDMNDLTKILKKTYEPDFLYELDQKNCKNRLRVPSGLTPQMTDQDMLNMIHSLLRDHHPVIANYHPNLGNLRNLGQASGVHSSIIVGSGFNPKTQSCDLLIKNSWGKECSSYQDIIRSSCDKGYIWVPESVLNQDLLLIMYMDGTQTK